MCTLETCAAHTGPAAGHRPRLAYPASRAPLMCASFFAPRHLTDGRCTAGSRCAGATLLAHAAGTRTPPRGAQAAATASRCTSCCATRPTRASWTPRRRARPRRAWPRSPAACADCRRAPRPRCWPACASWPPRPRTRRRRRAPCRRAPPGRPPRRAALGGCGHRDGKHHAPARQTCSSRACARCDDSTSIKRAKRWSHA